MAPPRWVAPRVGKVIWVMQMPEERLMSGGRGIYEAEFGEERRVVSWCRRRTAREYMLLEYIGCMLRHAHASKHARIAPHHRNATQSPLALPVFSPPPRRGTARAAIGAFMSCGRYDIPRTRPR